MTRTNANAVADYLLCFAHEHGDLISNLKLQKLVYYAQAWFLALNENDQLIDEDFEAWVHGPVQPALYRRFRANRWNPINVDPEKPELDNDIESFLNEVIDVYWGFSAYELERLTHAEDPWNEARGDIPVDELSNAVISTESIKAYYSNLLDN